MKKKERTSLQAMTPEELSRVIQDASDALAAFHVNRYSKQSKNVREGKNLRKKIAVAKTFVRLKELSHE